MCEFCVKHGEGKKWYLNAKNYSADLLSDLRRRKLAKDFFSWVDRSYNREFKLLEKLPLNIPLLGGLLKTIIRRSYINRHWGQVIPIEDIEKVLSFTNSIVRIPCICRKVKFGKEIRSCFFVSLNPSDLKMVDLLDQSFFKGPNVAEFENVNKTSALQFMRNQEAEGVFHTIWTHGAPYTAAICNCSNPGCLAFEMYKCITPNFFRAEYVIDVDKDKCIGCKKCSKICLFTALKYDQTHKLMSVDYKKCYGCGICRIECKQNALRLIDRQQKAEALKLWF